MDDGLQHIGVSCHGAGVIGGTHAKDDRHIGRGVVFEVLRGHLGVRFLQYGASFVE